MNATNGRLVNAWIYMGQEDVVGYNDPASSYQSLIKNNVYQAVDILFICFVTTTPTGVNTIPAGDGSSYTITLSLAVHGGGGHPGGLTNQDYMDYVIRDSRKNNPKIKIAVTLEWGEEDVLSRIFSNKQYTDEQNADNFAANLMAYLKSYNLDGFDIDWESPMYYPISQTQCKLLLDAIGTQFRKQTGKHYYLSLSPAQTDKLDPVAVNTNVDFLNLQLYYDSGLPDEFTSMGVKKELLADGVSFEAGDKTAQQAYDDYTQGGYSVITNWRLNSGNFDFEQTNQKQLYQLVYTLR